MVVSASFNQSVIVSMIVPLVTYEWQRQMRCGPAPEEPAIQGRGPGKYSVSAELQLTSLQTTRTSQMDTLMPAKTQPVRPKTPARSSLLGSAGGKGNHFPSKSLRNMGFNGDMRTVFSPGIYQVFEGNAKHKAPTRWSLWPCSSGVEDALATGSPTSPTRGKKNKQPGN